MKQVRSAVLAATLALAGAIISSTAASAAIATPSRNGELVTSVENSFRVDAGELVLTSQPGGGYAGVLTVTATYTGIHASVDDPTLTIAPPANFALGQLTGAGMCFYANGFYRCSAQGTFVKDVAVTLTIGFIGFAAPADYARRATGGSVQLAVGQEPSGECGTAKFSGVLAAADGSIRHPVRYTPAAAPDMSIISSDMVMNNGVLAITATVKDLNDAYNYGAYVIASVPGVMLTFLSVSPPTMCAFPSCQVPGGTLYEGNERTIQLAYLVSGASGSFPGTFTVGTNNSLGGNAPEDLNPADNSVAFTVIIP